MKQTLFDYCENNNKQYLLDEWDYKKNDSIGLFVNKVSYGSGKIANWKCKNNHEYQRRIDARTSNNSKCPYCESNKKTLLTNFNDFATLYPNLLQEWDYDKNLGIDPEHLLPSSNKKVWWKCKQCGGSWQSMLRQRTVVKQGCPFCAHIKPIDNINDFQTLYPDLMKDWDFTKNIKNPNEYTAHSGKKVWWKCHHCGHEWQSTIHNRTTNKRNCPSCTMRTTSFGEQALFYYVKKIFPDAVNRYRIHNIELDVFIPSINTGIEFDGLYWHNTKDSILREEKKYYICKQHNIKLIRVRDSNARFSYNSCDYSMQIENLHENNQLNSIIRLLLKELDPASNHWTRRNPYQLWSRVDAQIDVDKDRFEILNNKFLTEKHNSFIYKHPEVFQDWNYERNQSFNPQAFTSHSTMKVWWKCHDCGYEWEAKINDRTTGHNKCPICNNTLLKEGVNDFATLYPDKLEEWNYNKNKLLPNKILKKTGTKVWWVCKKCGHEWQAALGDRTRKDKPSGCPNCQIINASLAKHLKAMNRGSLCDTHPDLLSEWDYERNTINPNQVTHGANVYVWRKCKQCGYSWQTTINNWTRKKSKCPRCKKKTETKFSLSASFKNY